MISKCYFPKDLKVRQVVNFMGYVEILPDDVTDGWFGLLTNGTTNITISLGSSDVEYNNSKGNSLLFTSYSLPTALKKKKGMKFLQLQLKPFGFYYLKQMPSTDLCNKILTLDTFFKSSECEMLLDKLLSSSSPEKIFETMESFLSERLDLDRFDNRLPYSISLIKKQQDIGLDHLSDAVCLSPRRFRELFRNMTGLSPSYNKKVVRFKSASKQMEQAPNIPLTQIALANNYYDQAHFIKDFKTFSGITPKQFLRQKVKSADFYNFDLDNIHKFAKSD